MIQKWIIKHPSVVASSIAKEKILVRDNLTGKKTNRMGKHLIQVSIRELNNN